MKNIPFGKPVIDPKVIPKIKEILNSGQLVHGVYQKNFEEIFKKQNNSAYVTTVTNCTSGMFLYYMSKKLKKGDEVIVPATTHVATAHAIEATGAKPVFVDVNIENGSINLDQAKKKINSKTRGLVVVHYLGFPINIEQLSYFRKKGLFIVEDCALAIGSSYNNIKVGNFGDCASFSFYPVKHITTGEGGMIILKNKKDFLNILSLKSFGYFHKKGLKKTRYNYDVKDCGLNFRLNEISCCIGESQLKDFSKIKKIRNRNFKLMKKKFLNIPEVSFMDEKNKKYNPNYYAFSVTLNNKNKDYRNKFIQKLKNVGIGASVYYPKPLPEMDYYKKKYNIKEKFSNSKIISYNSFVLPIGQHINQNDIEYIYQNFKKIIYETK
tara:strand:- start:54 stop:1193 length:1140 start_codon:yes stop_codon:yes gene_type:complete